jgi:hypothetical protein
MPAKFKPLADMVAPSIKDWKLVAENVKVSFQKRMPKEYKDKAYSSAYAKRKAAGKAKRKGTAQVSTSRSPDLTLTGKMLQQIVATSTGTSGKLEFQNGGTVDGLDRRGKFPMFKNKEPASKMVAKDIEKYVNELYGKRVKAQSEKIVIRI